jgi:hypothetical protein
MKARFWEQWTPRNRKLLLWAFRLALVYAIIGFLVLPPIVRYEAVTQLSRQLGRPVSIDRVVINPFVLSVSIHGLLIKDPDGQPFVSWDNLYVNLQLSSFLGHAWVFQEISASRPFIRVRMNRDGTFNFSDLVTKFSTNAPAAKTAPARPLEVHVGRLHIGGATAALADLTPRQPFKRQLGPLDITLNQFRTEPGNKNPYAFTGTTDAGETISWSGFFSLSPLRSEGRLQLFHFSLTKYAPLYQDLLRFEVRDGSIALDTKYRVEFSATNRVAAVEDLACSLSDFKLGVAGDRRNLVEVPLFSVLDANVDLQNHVANVGAVWLDGARALVQRDPSATVNLVELSRPAASATNAPGGILFLLRSVTNAVSLLLASTNQWSATIHEINATNCALHLDDRANPRPARLDLSDISLTAKDLSNLPGTNFSADFSLRWNTNGAIHIAADVGFQPATADVNVDVDRLDLTTLDAYLASQLNLYILGSEVNLHGTVRLRPQVNNLPVVSFNGDASLEHFRTVDGVLGEDLVKWDALRFNGIVVNLNPPLVAVREIVADNAYARLVVETNHTINLVNVLHPAGAAAPATNGVPPAAAAGTTNPPIQISIGTVVITNTSFHFTDLSVAPPVNLAVQSVDGSIANLSTEELEHGVVNLSAMVDGIGPAAITGTINPLKNTQTNDLKISVQDVDLTPASPYAGKFAGYGIAEGKLNLELQYQLVGRNLSSKNVITLDHFTFGDKVNSPDATHLPVRLAVAILKDRDGKIVLDVPIGGNLDDPKFHLGKVITRAVLNILEKVATSPFSLLGAAFGGGGEELGWQDFAAGGADLTAADRQKLDSLARALYARPALQLAIAGSIDPEGDREGLERAALDHEIRARLWAKLRKSVRATNSVDQVVVPADERERYVEKLFREAFAAKKITPALVAANSNLVAYAAEQLARQPSVKKGAAVLLSRRPKAAGQTGNAAKPVTKLDPPPTPSEALLLATFPVNEADFEALAARRARAVQAYLLDTGKVEPARIFVTVGGAETLRRDGSRAYLEFR